MWWLLLAGLLQPDSTRIEKFLLRDGSPLVQAGRQVVEQFERRRRDLLPPSSSGGGGRCDERIGRFCYWYDESDTTLSAEPQAIRQLRSRLIDSLAKLSALQPRNDWLIGQRVRYLAEQEQPDSAVVVAQQCEASGWWCDALRGFALHVAERFADANRAFQRTVDSIPEELLCRWADWRRVVPASHAKRVAACERHSPVVDSLFWLATPLLSRPGNDLRSEFMARRVVAALHGASISPHLIPWGTDLEEMMVRYGWSTRWSRSEPPLSGLDPPSMTGHQRAPAYGFFPLIDDSAWRWGLGEDRPTARYGPTYATRFEEAKDFQIARFPRGDSTIVVGALTPGRETKTTPSTVWIAGSSGPLVPPSVAGGDSTRGLVPLVLRMSGYPTLAGIEARAGSRFLRGRDWRPAPPNVLPLALSDLLLFAPGEELPIGLEEAAVRALPSATVQRGRPVGIYWEASGLGADSIEVAVSLLPLARGLLGRVGQSMKLVKRRAPLTLQWHAPSAASATVGRSFELDLRRQSKGRYLLRLEAKSKHGTAVTSRLVHLTS